MWRSAWLLTNTAARLVARREARCRPGSGRHLPVAAVLALALLSLAFVLGHRIRVAMEAMTDAAPVHAIRRVLLVDEVSEGVVQLLPYLDSRTDPGPFAEASIRAAARALLNRLDDTRTAGVAIQDPLLAEDFERLRRSAGRLLAEDLSAPTVARVRIQVKTLLGRLERRYRATEQEIARRIEDQNRATMVFLRETALLIAYMVLLALGAVSLFLHSRIARERAAVNHRRLEAAIACLPDGFALYDADDRLVLCNRRYREIYPRTARFVQPGVRFEELLRKGVESGEYLDALEDPEGWLADRIAHHTRADGRPVIQQLVDGRVLRVSEHRTPDGDRVGLRVDITELEAHKRAIAASEARWRGLAETAPIGIWHLSREGRTLYANPALSLLLGRDPGEDLRGRWIGQLVEPGRASRLAEFFAGSRRREPASLEMALRGVDGILRQVLIVAKRLERGSEGAVIATVLDITPQKRALAEVERLAMSDPLTGLANRHRLSDFLDEALARGRGELGLLLIDLDGFKEINDSFGHEAGDAVLVAVAERLSAFAREEDLAARLGGDEFALVVCGRHRPAELEKLAERLIAEIGRPILLPTTRCHLGLSIGVAVAPAHGHDRAVLMRHADLALYRAKREGRGRYMLYRREFSAASRRRRRLTQALRRALENGEFELVFHPQVCSRGGHPVGAEVLLRWYDAVAEQPVSPAEFVPVAEESGLVLELDRYVLHSAMRAIAEFEDVAPPEMIWGVNISAAHIREARLVETVAAALEERGIAPGKVELEVTENVFIRDLEAGKRALEALKELGVKLALDDFGTGYSSLAYLSELPFDRLKIDRSFIFGLEKNSQYRTVVRAIVGLGRRLGMEVVAEGVETETQRRFLAAEGCRVIQGYLIARPMPRTRFRSWLAARRCGAAGEDVAISPDARELAVPERDRSGRNSTNR